MEDEIHLLQKYAKTSPLVLIRLKSYALLMRNQKVKVKTIATVVDRNPSTVSKWMSDFNRERIASIFTGHENNENASKLTKKQKEEIRKILKQPPSDETLPTTFWDVPKLKEYVKAEFGTVYESNRSYHFLLKFSNLSFKYPSTFSNKRNDKLIELRMVEIRKEINKYLKSDAWEVFASDETRIQLEALIRRAWIKKGEKTVVKVTKSKQAQNYLGHLNLKTGYVDLFELPWQNQDEILKSFETFLPKYENKKICIIWDNAAFHRGQKIRKALTKGNLLENVHLINLPPYAPDKNPIELVWGKTKDKISNTQFKDLEETKNQFETTIKNRMFEYKI